MKGSSWIPKQKLQYNVGKKQFSLERICESNHKMVLIDSSACFYTEYHTREEVEAGKKNSMYSNEKLQSIWKLGELVRQYPNLISTRAIVDEMRHGRDKIRGNMTNPWVRSLTKLIDGFEKKYRGTFNEQDKKMAKRLNYWGREWKLSFGDYKFFIESLGIADLFGKTAVVTNDEAMIVAFLNFLNFEGLDKLREEGLKLPNKNKIKVYTSLKSDSFYDFRSAYLKSTSS